MILGVVYDGKGAINLFVEHYPCQTVRERHRGHGHTEIRRAFELLGKPEGASHRKIHRAYTPVAKLQELVRQTLAGELLSLHAKRDGIRSGLDMRANAPSRFEYSAQASRK